MPNRESLLRAPVARHRAAENFRAELRRDFRRRVFGKIVDEHDFLGEGDAFKALAQISLFVAGYDDNGEGNFRGGCRVVEHRRKA